MRAFLRWLLRLFYDFRAYDLDALKTPGPVLLLPNHVSWWDWLIVGVCLDTDWRFVTSSTAAELSWFHKKIMVNRLTFPVDMNSPYAVKHMAEYLHKGGRLVLFPEGRISTTGSLMKLFEGTGFLIARTGAKIITAYIRGAEQLPFSRNPNLKTLFPRVSVHFSELLTPPPLQHLKPSQTRARLTEWLRDRMLEQRVKTEIQFGPATVLEAISAAARKRAGLKVVEDASLQTLSYRKLLTGARVLADRWTHMFGPGPENVGVLLPNANVFPVVMSSLWACGKVPAVLNYTTGAATMLKCAQVAGLKRVITSQLFLTRARLDVDPLRKAGIEIVCLEDVRPAISSTKRLAALLHQIVKPGLDSAAHTEDAAVILFTSGSEGEPKAVELSHKNILANIRQMLAVIDLMETDRFFTALPLFHSFGLTIGLILPLVHRVYVFLYTSPLHYRVIPSAFYNLNCTVLFGTNSFLSGYARKAHPYDFHTLRYVFAGAEKLQESTALTWMRKFGVRVLEGYGATECSPCVAVNVPLEPGQASAGRLLPLIDFKLEPVAGVGNGDGTTGRLFVRGPNVMRGYLNPEPNAKFKALAGWYDTGDIARVDASRFVYIQGRLKRFAKVSGEMVSLAAIEEALESSLNGFGPKFAVAVIAKHDEAKGEKLIAVTNEIKLTLDAIRDAVRARGLGNLAVPRELRVVHDIPRLGTGKINYRELEGLL